ncbi:MAG: type II toxin-antitoxin system RelE/ParE family toxin [Rhodomicrobium sp.]|jgi:addiction module RelE/StbE family toxin
MIVSYTPKSLRDLERIASYLEEHNRISMQRILAAIKHSIDNLQDYPELGKAVRGAQRRIPVPRSSYLVYYRIAGEEVLILHVRDGRRRPYRA